VGVGTGSLATWHTVPPSNKSRGGQIFNHQHGVVRESHFVLFENGENKYPHNAKENASWIRVVRRIPHGRKRNQKKATEEANFSKNIF
jgi:hypothetical protein